MHALPPLLMLECPPRSNLSLRARAMGLLQMYVNLDGMEAAAFGKIMAFRNTARVALRRFLALQETARTDRGEAAQGAAMAAAAKLCAFLPSGKAHASTVRGVAWSPRYAPAHVCSRPCLVQLRDLSKVKDQLVFKSLAKLVDASTPQSELFEARVCVLHPYLHVANRLIVLTGADVWLLRVAGGRHTTPGAFERTRGCRHQASAAACHAAHHHCRLHAVPAPVHCCTSIRRGQLPHCAMPLLTPHTTLPVCRTTTTAKARRQPVRC